MKIDTSKIAPSTIIRTLVLLTGLINLALTMCGKELLPFKDQDIQEFVAYIWAGASAIWAWWKNNSITEHAIQADKYKEATKAASAVAALSQLSYLPEPVQYFSDPEEEDEDDDDIEEDDDIEDDEDEDLEDEALDDDPDDEDIPEEDYDPEEDGDEEE